MDDRTICAECIEEDDLEQLINDAAEYCECSFCRRKSKRAIAARFEDICEHIRFCIRKEFDDPANGLGYESREGGYQGLVFSTYELIVEQLEIGFPNDKDDTLLWAVIGGADPHGQNSWTDNNFYGSSESEKLTYSWSGFREVVMHTHRFMFNDIEVEGHMSEELSPRDMLLSLQAIVEELDLIVDLSADEEIYRVRPDPKGEGYSNAAELGPPPTDLCLQANRMNPPGIPMLYGAQDLTTAIEETKNAPGKFVASIWNVTSPVKILDLSKLPEQPGFFKATEFGDDREEIRFLHHFVREASKPVPRDRSTKHVDYVPTQVFAEFVRYTRFGGTNDKVMGIRFPSSVVSGANSIVLFANQLDIVDGDWPEHVDPEPWLEMEKAWPISA